MNPWVNSPLYCRRIQLFSSSIKSTGGIHLDYRTSHHFGCRSPNFPQILSAHSWKSLNNLLMPTQPRMFNSRFTAFSDFLRFSWGSSPFPPPFGVLSDLSFTSSSGQMMLVSSPPLLHHVGLHRLTAEALIADDCCLLLCVFIGEDKAAVVHFTDINRWWTPLHSNVVYFTHIGDFYHLQILSSCQYKNAFLINVFGEMHKTVLRWDVLSNRCHQGGTGEPD